MSSSGKESFVSPPPWHFSGDVIWIEFEARPDSVAAFLPPGLELGDSAGACGAVFVDWQWCSDDRKELLDPVRCQFKECFLVLSCTYRGEPAARYPYVWVDRALSLVRGWIQGVPKSLGSIWMTRAIPVGLAGARRQAGERFAASLAADDRRLVEASVRLDEQVDRPPALDCVPPINSRLFPAWDPEQEGVDELVWSVVADREYSPIWRGDATLRFLPGGADGLLALAPVSVGSGYVFSYAETVVGGHRLHPVTSSP